MKQIKNTYKILITLLAFVACTEELKDLSFTENIVLPTNISAAYNITQDNSGLVTITPTAEGATYFDIHFGDATPEPVNVNQGQSVQHVYAEGTYSVKVVAYNLKGDTAEIVQELMVSFRAPENLVVTIENDPAISKQVNITATADFASMFEFHSGEAGVTQPVATANIGETISYQYQDAGTYSVKVVAKGGAIETTEYTADFEVTEIVAPIMSAATPPERDAADVISIYTSRYTDVAGTDTFPDWGQGGNFGSSWAEYDLNGDTMLQYINISYQGIQFGSAQDVSAMEYIHLDVWTPDVTRLETSLISVSNGEKPVWSDLTLNAWTSIDIPISAFTDQGLTVADIHQLKFVSEQPWPREGTVFIDNIYFYKAASSPPFDDGILTNGDFENGSDSWIVGVDDTMPASVVTNAGNTHYSANVTSAGNPWDVNVSQKVEIIQGNTYTLTFDAWSDVNRSMIAGIGLSADPWSNDIQTVDITTTKTTYTLTLSASNFGATDARVLFDLGADVGEVNIDNVSLIIGTGNIIVNGDFENGSDPWIVGVDDTMPAPVVTNGGNTHYSANITAAGNPWDVNVSQKLEIVEGNTYTLTFDAWSDVNRSMIAGIGLSADPWSNDIQTINITATRTTYTLTLSASGFGASDARVIFDLGADVGLVNIDDVSLSSN